MVLIELTANDEVTPAEPCFNGPTLISSDILELLSSFEGVSLEEKLKCMAEEREDLLRELRSTKLDLEEERQQNRSHELGNGPSANGPSASTTSSTTTTTTTIASASTGTTTSPGSSETELKKMLHEYKFRLKRAEQEITLLQGNNNRLENQLTRYKNQCEQLEKSEEDLKTEKRRILRELREIQSKADDLETQNENLQKRIHKLKENRSTLLISGPHEQQQAPNSLTTKNCTESPVCQNSL